MDHVHKQWFMILPYRFGLILMGMTQQAKNAFFVFFGCFWTYVGQPQGHIGWATSMPFASINPTNPRTNLSFFESAILNLKKIKNKCFIPIKTSPKLYGRMDGWKFWCLPWFPENSLLCVILCYTVQCMSKLFNNYQYLKPLIKKSEHFDSSLLSESSSRVFWSWFSIWQQTISGNVNIYLHKFVGKL